MDDTIREGIVTKMIARFEGITTAAGYNTDLGNNVYHFRDSDFEADKLPALNIIDATNNIDRGTTTHLDNMLDVELQVKVGSGETSYEDAYRIIQDVYRAIAVDDTWDGLALDTLPVSDEIETEHAAKVICSITIKIQVQYQAAKWTF